uniref:Uncharacterized protein n=1 Tax=Oryza sativa subsp. japonica TaxID=39947 RepID=Q7Y1J3_ORYSJ|nr:hypothetical protein [Oryza sativa Japonica Group]
MGGCAAQAARADAAATGQSAARERAREGEFKRRWREGVRQEGGREKQRERATLPLDSDSVQRTCWRRRERESSGGLVRARQILWERDGGCSDGNGESGGMEGDDGCLGKVGGWRCQ